MTRTFALVAGAFVASVAFSGASFAQTRPADTTLDGYRSPAPYVAVPSVALSRSDMRAQQLNDLRQQTTDSGLPIALSAAPEARSLRPTAHDRALEGVYRERDATQDD